MGCFVVKVSIKKNMVKKKNWSITLKHEIREKKKKHHDILKYSCKDKLIVSR
jgi:hypothetical protein